MTKFLAFDIEAADPDSENAGNVKVTAVLFAMEHDKQSKKLDELLLFIKPEKEFHGDILDIMNLFMDNAMDKLIDLLIATDIILTDKEILAAYCGHMMLIARLTINVREMAKCLIKDFEMEQGENRCEIIINTLALIWEKQTFMHLPYSPEFQINNPDSKR